MFEIFLFFFISSIILVFSGRFFLKCNGTQLDKTNLSLSEQGFYGLIFISFLTLLFNFFFKIDQNLASAFIIIPVIQIFLEFKKFNFELVKKIILHSTIISFFSLIFISFDNVYRPDAGIYHLPFTKIINDFKIFFGVVSLNPVFGVTSIMQYSSAFFNNLLFKDVGVTIPLALLTIYLIEYFCSQFFSKNKNYSYKFFLFLVITYVFLEMNRYSEYGNDNPAHLALFYLVTLLLRNNFTLKEKINFKLFTLVALFIFLNKLFFIFILFIPIIFWVSNKLYLSKKYFPLFSIIFFSLWITKNIIVSGCFFYPVKITCNDKLSWYSNDPKFIIAAENLSQFSELHAKNWKGIVDDKQFSNYQNNLKEKENFLEYFNWLRSDKISKSPKYGFVKIFNNYIFIILIALLLIVKFRKGKIKKSKYNLNLNLLFFISLASTILLMYKLPLGRYGTSYLIILLFFFFTLINNDLSFLRKTWVNKFLSFLVIFTGSIFLIKNTFKIVKNIDANFYQKPWPRIYENKEDLKALNSLSNQPVIMKYVEKDKTLKIYYVNNLNYWTSDRSKTCMYNQSPCAQTSKNFNTFKVSKTNTNHFIIKLNK